jgi:tetratricopeptide (TPR) repeat protein
MYFHNGVATMAVTLQITDITTGRVVVNREFRAVATQNVDLGMERFKFVDPSPCLAAARAKCIAAFVQVIAPHTVVENMPFEKDDTLPGTERGIALAHDDLARAAATFQEVASGNPTNARAHYNLGLAQLCLGQHDEAIASLDRAFRMNASRKYGRELARAREWKANAERLRQQGPGSTVP